MLENIGRNDMSKDRSLRAWSAADESLLNHVHELASETSKLTVYHDRFGFLSCNLHKASPTIIRCYNSQQKAISENLKQNQLSELKMVGVLDALDEPMDVAIMKIPKSLDLFKFYLQHIVQNSSADVTVLCGFMTRHFSPKILQIAAQYFENVSQSTAQKKARVLTLSKKKVPIRSNPFIEISFNKRVYKQYEGVFSRKHIDYATQLLIAHIQLSDNDQKVLDLGSGNGVIAAEIQAKRSDVELHLVDDSILAVASAKLNIQGDDIHHYCLSDLSSFEGGMFDLIVTNPPFHFEYETNIDISIELFKQSYRCLKEGGRLMIVANKHLNYKSHLMRIFEITDVIVENEKYVVYQSYKGLNPSFNSSVS